MSDAEISGNFRRNGKNKKQIKILAELNAVSEKEIEEVLIRTGEMKPKKKKE